MAKCKLLHFEYRHLIADIINLIIAFFLVIWIVPMNADEPVIKYAPFYAIVAFSWMFFAWLMGRYAKPLSEQGYFHTTMTSFNASLIALAIGELIFYFLPNYSGWVMLGMILTGFTFWWIIQTLYFAYVYASDPEEGVVPIPKREPKSVIKAPYIIPEESYLSQKKAMEQWMGEKAFAWLSAQVDLHSSNTVALATTTLFNVENIFPYKYDTIINVRSLNNIRGINKMFSAINEKLPDNGLYVGVFKDKAVKKRQILQKYPKGINWIVYSFYYFFKRVIPKLFLTKRLYYDITHGKRRVLTKTEVFGRLYYCGFEIVNEKKIEHYTYFIARRVKEPPMHKKRRYGPLIALNRVGKNGKVFKFYKMRTMYPYSEFLQEYIYQKCNLQEGGKFNHDIRVSTLGRFMRRCWLDELPMFINLFKGDMKLVGVRPLSNQYFNLYCDELKELRVKFKPGLFPPFYADMPKTLDEIQASELKYLKACQTKGVFVTDVTYLWKIFVNIVFKKARSH